MEYYRIILQRRNLSIFTFYIFYTSWLGKTRGKSSTAVEDWVSGAPLTRMLWAAIFNTQTLLGTIAR